MLSFSTDSTCKLGLGLRLYSVLFAERSFLWCFPGSKVYYYILTREPDNPLYEDSCFNSSFVDRPTNELPNLFNPCRSFESYILYPVSNIPFSRSLCNYFFSRSLASQSYDFQGPTDLGICSPEEQKVILWIPYINHSLREKWKSTHVLLKFYYPL